MSKAARILLAEDDVVVSTLIVDILSDEGHRVTSCTDGQDAWERLGQDAAYDLILLDRLMPRKDGMAVLRAIKADPRFEHIPVIMETALQDQASIREGLDAGAHYYLTKPFQPEVLVAVVRAALQQYSEYRQLRDSVRAVERPFGFLREGVFQIRDLEEGRLLANLLARACPDPARAIHGLQELLINAVEHGNLGMTYAEKGTLLLADRWEQEVERRLGLPDYRERRVEIRFVNQPDRVEFTIRDQGDGFDWSKYLDFSPERAFDLHGRGIAMARKLSFDSLEYLGNGNTVVATIHPAGTGEGTG
jgi:CheY-like chemotaxis protein/anti-sigma regulatory factor (Ser/Thr protein kinase)